MSDALTLVIGALKGFTFSSLFVLALFIGFCVIVGFTKLKKTAGGDARVIKSLDERVTKQPMVYLPPTAPRGPADPLEGFGTRRSAGT
jgi:acid phosphatase family membrane protein YuiD